MSKLSKPEGYHALLDLKQTEMAIKKIKDFFLSSLSTELRLRRVTAPLFVLRGLGINDDLNGVERPVSFPIKDMGESVAEVVHSLAKWKRLTLAEYEIAPGFGIVTDMNAIRADEELDNLHPTHRVLYLRDIPSTGTLFTRGYLLHTQRRAASHVS